MFWMMPRVRSSARCRFTTSPTVSVGKSLLPANALYAAGLGVSGTGVPWGPGASQPCWSVSTPVPAPLSLVGLRAPVVLLSFPAPPLPSMLSSWLAMLLLLFVSMLPPPSSTARKLLPCAACPGGMAN